MENTVNIHDDCPYRVGDEGFAGMGDQAVKVVFELSDHVYFVGSDKGGGIWFPKELADRIPEPWRGTVTEIEADGAAVLDFALPRHRRKLV